MVAPVSVALKIGVTPATGLLKASARVMEIKDTATPLASTGVVPVMSEFATAGDPGLKTTVPPAFTTGVAIDNVLVSALVDARVQVETPEAFVTEQAPFVLVVPVFVALNVGVWPETGLEFASLKVMVTAEVAVPFAITGPVPVMVEFAATAEPAEKMTVPSAFTTGVAIDKLFDSAVVEANAQVEIPETLVAEQVP